MSRLWGGRRLGLRPGGFRDLVVKALLVGIPIIWFVFALEMTVLSQDRNPHHPQERQGVGAVMGQVFQIQPPDNSDGHRNYLQPRGRDLSRDTYTPPPKAAERAAVPNNAIVGGIESAQKWARLQREGGSRAEDQERKIRESVRKLDGADTKGGDGGGDKKPIKPKRLPIGLNQDRFAKRVGLGGGGGGVDGGDSSRKKGGADAEGSVERADVVAAVRFDPPKMGEQGQPAFVDPNQLTWQERAEYDAGYSTHNFNQFVSDRVSLQRTVPDYRHDKCGIDQYSGRLQQASVIMCFYNEAWSTLLRSVHSVLDRSPPNLLTELILVDDFSDLEHLKTHLDNYMKGFPKVKILRMPERVGLVRARLRGVEVAKGPILIFLDSHIECGDGWMEPLVSEVSRNTSVAVTPIIDIIDKDTLAVVEAVESVGVVDLRHMTFIWSQPTPRIQASRTSPAHPFMSPTMAGGLFAINKEFFQNLGTWDPGLVLWGGENLELSFKLWMCGGAILIHPCSRVSHIFRDKSPYLKANVDRVVKGNAARVAEVWLDNFKRFFFRGERYDPNVYGDISERQNLRERLSCKNFQWYIDNVYPEMFIDGAGTYMGQIMSATGMCLRYQDADQHALMLHEDCEGSDIWQSSRINEIRNGPFCLTAANGQIFATPCDSQQTGQNFEIVQQGPEVTMVHAPTKLCVAAVEAGSMGILQLAPCLYGDRRQHWTFQKNPTLLRSSAEL